MRIEATGPGRRGVLEEGVGKLTLSGAKGHEAAKLKILYEEIRDGNLGFWAPLMWAARQGLLTAKEEKQHEKIIDRITKAFEVFVGED